MVAATRGLRPSEVAARQAVAEQAEEALSAAMPAFDAAWLEEAVPGVAWIWPTAEFRPSGPSTKVAIQHGPRHQIDLRLNGRRVPATNLDGTKTSADGSVVVTTWRGVDLVEGENDFVAIVMDAAGNEIRRLVHTVHYASPPVLATFLPERSVLVADGKNPPVIAVRLTDHEGQPAREGVIGEFTIDPPYRAAQEFEAFLKNPLLGLNRERTSYVIGPDGVALIPIETTTRTGEGVVHFHFRNHDQEIRLWFEPAPRDWILVGIAEGTLGYNTLNGNMEGLGDSAPEDKWYDEGRVAFLREGRHQGQVAGDDRLRHPQGLGGGHGPAVPGDRPRAVLHHLRGRLAPGLRRLQFPQALRQAGAAAVLRPVRRLRHGPDCQRAGPVQPQLQRPEVGTARAQRGLQRLRRPDRARLPPRRDPR